MINYIPHENDFNVWKSRLTDVEMRAIKNHINSLVDGNEVRTSSWLPGDDWSNTPLHAIYEKACKENEAASGLCFGLFVWEVMMEREEDWAFGRYEKDGIPIKGLTYFKINRPSR